jgi:hypothetical protein
MFKKFLVTWAVLLVTLGGAVGVLYVLTWLGKNLPIGVFVFVLVAFMAGIFAALDTWLS